MDAETPLQQAAHVGEYLIGRGGADDHQIDIFGPHTRRLHGVARRQLAEIQVGLVIGSDVAAFDTAA